MKSEKIVDLVKPTVNKSFLPLIDEINKAQRQLDKEEEKNKEAQRLLDLDLCPVKIGDVIEAVAGPNKRPMAYMMVDICHWTPKVYVKEEDGEGWYEGGLIKVMDSGGKVWNCWLTEWDYTAANNDYVPNYRILKRAESC